MALPFGRYQLLRKIASGGMGQVFLARAEGASGFEKLVVIKRVLPHLAEDPEFLAMFLDEAKIAARLNHHNLVQIFELGEEKGSVFIAMEYVPGEDLRRVGRYAKARGKPLPLGLACRVIADAAAGLHHAHQATDGHGRPLQLVHRDVSPQNVLLGFSGAVKLIDFGVAKAAGRSQKTASGVLKGKVPYFSPEQALGKQIDHRSDQFSLAIVFWELLTGERLFKADDDLATLERVKTVEIPRPSSLVKLPPALDALVMRALSRRPEDRFSDCGALRLGIEEVALKEALPASTAHLGAYMQELYAERIAQMRAGEEDQLSIDADVDQIPTPGRNSIGPMPGKGGRTMSVSQPAVSRRWPIGVAVGAAVIALAATAAVLSTRPTPAPAEPIARTTPAPKPTPPRPAPAPAPAPAQVTLLSEPRGAEIEIDGAPAGRTPLTIGFPAGQTRSVRLHLAGYEPAEQTLDGKTPLVTVTLKRHARSTPRLSIKTGR